MDTKELKKNIHLLVDSIDNENILYYLYANLKESTNTKEGLFWDRLTPQEQKEAGAELMGIKNDEFSIKFEELKKKYKRSL